MSLGVMEYYLNSYPSRRFINSLAVARLKGNYYLSKKIQQFLHTFWIFFYVLNIYGKKIFE